jgi:hypothetical protein
VRCGFGDCIEMALGGRVKNTEGPEALQSIIFVTQNRVGHGGWSDLFFERWLFSLLCARSSPIANEQEK